MNKYSLLLFFAFMIFANCTKTSDLSKGPMNKDELLDGFAKSLSSAAANPEFRYLLKEEALKQIDYDYNIIWALFKDTKMSSGLSAEQFVQSHSDNHSIDDIYNQVPLLNIGVPIHINKWDTEAFQPSTLSINSNYLIDNISKIYGYDHNGNTISADAETIPNDPYLVVGESERMLIDDNGELVFNNAIQFVSRQDKSTESKLCFPSPEPGSWAWGNDCDVDPTPPGSTPDCSVPSNGLEVILTGLRSDDLSAIEGWFAGAPELMLSVFHPTSLTDPNINTIFRSYWEPPKRSDIDYTWWNPQSDIITWFLPSSNTSSLGANEFAGINTFWRWDEIDTNPGTAYQSVRREEYRYQFQTYPYWTSGSLQTEEVGIFEVYIDDPCYSIYGNSKLKMKLYKK